jgi:hypothetical protein
VLQISWSEEKHVVGWSETCCFRQGRGAIQAKDCPEAPNFCPQAVF